MNARQSVTYDGSIWTVEQFAALIDKIVADEMPPATAAQARNLRRMVVRDITLCAIPAGNA